MLMLTLRDCDVWSAFVFSGDYWVYTNASLNVVNKFHFTVCVQFVIDSP